MKAPPRGGGPPVLYQQLGCFLVCRTWSLHTYIGRLEGGGACSTACDTGSAGSEAPRHEGGAHDKRDRDGRGRPRSKSRSVAVFPFLFFPPLSSRRRRYFTPRRTTRRLDCRSPLLPVDFRETEISRMTESVWATALISETRVATVSSRGISRS